MYAAILGVEFPLFSQGDALGAALPCGRPGLQVILLGSLTLSSHYQELLRTLQGPRGPSQEHSRKPSKNLSGALQAPLRTPIGALPFSRGDDFVAVSAPRACSFRLKQRLALRPLDADPWAAWLE